MHSKIRKQSGTNDHHDKMMCRGKEPYRLVKGQGHSPPLNFVHRQVEHVRV